MEAQADALREESGEGVGLLWAGGQQGHGSGVGRESGEPKVTPSSRLQRAWPAVAEEPPAPDSCPPGRSPQPRPPSSLRPARQLGPGSVPVLPGTGCPACPRSGAAALRRAAFSLHWAWTEHRALPEHRPQAEGSWGWRTSALGPRGPSETSVQALSPVQAEGPGPPPISRTEEGSGQPSCSQFPAHPADSGLTP